MRGDCRGGRCTARRDVDVPSARPVGSARSRPGHHVRDSGADRDRRGGRGRGGGFAAPRSISRSASEVGCARHRRVRSRPHRGEGLRSVGGVRGGVGAADALGCVGSTCRIRCGATGAVPRCDRRCRFLHCMGHHLCGRGDHRRSMRGGVAASVDPRLVRPVDARVDPARGHRPFLDRRQSRHRDELVDSAHPRCRTVGGRTPRTSRSCAARGWTPRRRDPPLFDARSGCVRDHGGLRSGQRCRASTRDVAVGFDVRRSDTGEDRSSGDRGDPRVDAATTNGRRSGSRSREPQIPDHVVDDRDPRSRHHSGPGGRTRSHSPAPAAGRFATSGARRGLGLRVGRPSHRCAVGVRVAFRPGVRLRGGDRGRPVPAGRAAPPAGRPAMAEAVDSELVDGHCGAARGDLVRGRALQPGDVQRAHGGTDRGRHRRAVAVGPRPTGHLGRLGPADRAGSRGTGLARMAPGCMAQPSSPDRDPPVGQHHGVSEQLLPALPRRSVRHRRRLSCGTHGDEGLVPDRRDGDVLGHGRRRPGTETDRGTDEVAREYHRAGRVRILPRRDDRSRDRARSELLQRTASGLERRPAGRSAARRHSGVGHRRVAVARCRGSRRGPVVGGRRERCTATRSPSRRSR